MAEVDVIFTGCHCRTMQVSQQCRYNPADPDNDCIEEEDKGWTVVERFGIVDEPLQDHAHQSTLDQEAHLDDESDDDLLSIFRR